MLNGRRRLGRPLKRLLNVPEQVYEGHLVTDDDEIRKHEITQTGKVHGDLCLISLI